MTGREIRSIGVTGPGRVAMLTDLRSEPGPGQAWVRTEWSGISAGTEVALIRGTDPHHVQGWDAESRTFGAPAPRAAYPIRGLGYMEVARVTESRAAAFVEGSLLAMAYGHSTGHCVDQADVAIPVPDDLDPMLGIYLAQLGPICVNGLLHATAAFHGPMGDVGSGVRGRCVLVTGAGVIGLLTALLAGRHGATDVVIAEPSSQRRAVAEALGVAAIDDSEGQAWRAAKRRWHRAAGEPGADVVFQCRGHDSSLRTALKSLRPHGVVIDLAFYQGGACNVRLGEEFHHNGLSVICAQIGRVPRGMAEGWPRPALSAVTLDLLRERAADILRHFITDVVDFADGPALLCELAERRRPALQAVLRVRGS